MKIKAFSSLLTGTGLTGSPGASFGSKSAGYTPMVSNIKSGGYNSLRGTGVDETKIYSVIGKSLNKYLERIDELETYIESSITRTSVDVIKDAVQELMTNNLEIITIKEDPEAQKKINKILNDIQLVNHIQSDLFDIIYYGSYSYYFESLSNKFNIRYLKEPNKVISIWKNNRLQGYLTNSLDGNLKEFKSHELITISTNDYKLELEDDLGRDGFKELVDEILEDERFDPNKKVDEKDEIKFKSYDKRYLAGSPLFNSITGKIKEYILKDYLLSILSIKDLIQPIILLVSLEKSTVVEEGLDLALEVENLINQNLDLSFMEAKGLSVKELAMSLIDNIRVLPDYDGKLGGMANLDLDKLSEKIERIRSDQSTIREDIINSIGLPIDLFEGRSSRWESIKMSQRFESKVSYYADMINTSVINLAESIYNRLTQSKLKGNISGKIVCNLVDTEALESSRQAARLEAMTDQLNKLLDLSELVTRSDESSIIDIQSLKEYLKNSLDKMTESSMGKLININKKVEKKDEESGFGGY